MNNSFLKWEKDANNTLGVKQNFIQVDELHRWTYAFELFYYRQGIVKFYRKDCAKGGNFIILTVCSMLACPF